MGHAAEGQRLPSSVHCGKWPLAIYLRDWLVSDVREIRRKQTCVSSRVLEYCSQHSEFPCVKLIRLDRENSCSTFRLLFSHCLLSPLSLSNFHNPSRSFHEALQSFLDRICGIGSIGCRLLRSDLGLFSSFGDTIIGGQEYRPVYLFLGEGRTRYGHVGTRYEPRYKHSILSRRTIFGDCAQGGKNGRDVLGFGFCKRERTN